MARVEGRRRDALVLGQQVVGELVEIADPADHRRRRRGTGRSPAAARRGAPHPSHRPGRTGSAGARRRRRPDRTSRSCRGRSRAAGVEELRDDVAADESGRAGDEDAHSDTPRRAMAGGRTFARWLGRGSRPGHKRMPNPWRPPHRRCPCRPSWRPRYAFAVRPGSGCRFPR